MCCNTGSHQGFQGRALQPACFCGCEGPAIVRPRFMSEKQRIARLQEHLQMLQDEAKAVEEHIARIRKEK